MTSAEAYKRFLLKINKNDTNEGINILPSHFVLLYNTERLLWLGDTLKNESDNIKIDRIQELIVTDEELSLSSKKDDSVNFTIPTELYRYVSSYTIADKGFCTGLKLYNFEKKPSNKTAFLADAFSKPSFDFEEVPVILGSNNLQVFFDDFEVKKAFLTYYRNPAKIDLPGYTGFDGQPSTNINPDLSDENVDEINEEVIRQYQDAEGMQYAKDRIQSEP